MKRNLAGIWLKFIVKSGEKHRKWGKISREKNIDRHGGKRTHRPTLSPLRIASPFYIFIQQLVLFRSHTHKIRTLCVNFSFSLSHLFHVLLSSIEIHFLFCLMTNSRLNAYFVFIYEVKCLFLTSLNVWENKKLFLPFSAYAEREERKFYFIA